MKRWLGLFVVLAVVAIAATVLSLRTFSREAQFEMVQPGMSRNDVVRLLGNPIYEDRLPDAPEHFMVWQLRDDRYPCVVYFDADGSVTGKHWSGCAPRY